MITIIRSTGALLLLLTSACAYRFENPRLQVVGMTEEDLVAPPGRHEIRSRLTYDIREVRRFRERLDEGSSRLPGGLVWTEGQLQLKRTDGHGLWKFALRTDPAEKRSAVTETVFWDEEGQVYFYRYEGGDPAREVWFGPVAVKFHRSTLPDDLDH